MDEPLALCVLDAAVNHGVARAKSWLAITPDPCEYLNVREQFYRALVVKRPASQKFLHGWLKRVNTLRQASGC